MKDKIKNIIDFFNDDTVYFAASLSFFTIFSMLPILALLLVVMSSTPYFASQIDLLMTYVYDFINPTHSNDVILLIQGSLKNISSLGNIGTVYLVVIFFLFFKDYEYIINKIHHTKKRKFFSFIFLYLSFLIIVPISLIILTFFTSYANGNILINIINNIFALIILTILFKISANKYISFKATIISSTLTLLSLKVTQVVFMYYIAYNTTYTTIYGTLSAVLFMFLWIYFSWIVYLYGIKLSYILNIGK